MTLADRQASRLTRFQVVCLILAVVGCRAFAVQACPTYDDAFITYRYARNLASGYGLVFNPGAAWEPVLGTTTTLYALTLAALARLGADLVQASLVVNVLCDAASAYLIVRILAHRRVASTAAVLVFAALPEIVRISVGGMEAPAFALLGLGAALAAQRRYSVLAGLLAALACLVRPEGVLLAVIVLAARWREPRELLRALVPISLVGVISMLALNAFYGTFIPHSVVAKAAIAERHEDVAAGARWKAILSGAFLPRAGYLALLPFVALGLWSVVRTAGAARIFSGFALAITLGYLVARPHTWGWYFYVPLVAWTLWLALGIERVWTFVRARLSSGFERALERFGPQTLGALALVLVALVSRARPSGVTALVYAPLGEWAARTSAAEPAARILASDIGAVGYSWNGVVLDGVGLVWPEALRYGSVNNMIASLRPEYVLVVCERWSLEQLEHRPDLRALYVPIARFNASGARELEPRASDVPEAWSQDYLVLRLRTH